MWQLTLPLLQESEEYCHTAPSADECFGENDDSELDGSLGALHWMFCHRKLSYSYCPYDLTVALS